MPDILIAWEKLPPVRRQGRQCFLSVPLSDAPSDVWREQLQNYLLDSNQEPRDPADRTWLHNPVVGLDAIEVELPDENIPPSLRPYLDKLVAQTNKFVA